uniref:Uncharacterized protein n=1 Tax=Glossina austeni TaxID=7395 RepID=A0A1A9UDU9_GLOAU
MCPRKKIPPMENKSILWCILNDAVTEGGCLRNKTSTGSLEDKHIICSAQAGCEQHSLSEQSVMPSENKDIGLYIVEQWLMEIYGFKFHINFSKSPSPSNLEVLNPMAFTVVGVDDFSSKFVKN